MEVLKITLTSILSVCALFIITKLMGRRQISQLDFFDYITGITLGSIAAELATDIDAPWQSLIAMAVYLIFSLGLNAAARKWPRTRKFLSGTPTILMDNGKLYRENMKKCKIDLSEFLVMCRQEGYFDLAAIQTAVFEYNGRMTILPATTRRPVTPEDMQLTPPKETFFVEVIMDGQILHTNLKRMGADLNWLNTQLKAQGYKSTGEVFLALCDRGKNLAVYQMH